MSMANIAKKRYVKSKSIKDLERFAFQKIKKKHPSNPYPPKPQYKDNTSNGLTKCVIDFIKFLGYQAERINSMGRPVDQRKTVTDVIGRTRTLGDIKWIKGNSKTGTSDISATIKGRSVKIEIKCRVTGDHYQSEGQKQYQKEVEAAGGIYVIARDFEGFYQWLKKFLQNEG